jgi:hypothetical protein
MAQTGALISVVAGTGGAAAPLVVASVTIDAVSAGLSVADAGMQELVKEGCVSKDNPFVIGLDLTKNLVTAVKNIKDFLDPTKGTVDKIGKALGWVTNVAHAVQNEFDLVTSLTPSDTSALTPQSALSSASALSSTSSLTSTATASAGDGLTPEQDAALASALSQAQQSVNALTASGADQNTTQLDLTKVADPNLLSSIQTALAGAQGVIADFTPLVNELQAAISAIESLGADTGGGGKSAGAAVIDTQATGTKAAVTPGTGDLVQPDLAAFLTPRMAQALNDLPATLDLLYNNVIGTPANAPYMIQFANGNVIHGVSDAGGSINVFTPTNAAYTLTIVDPSTLSVGTVSGVTGFAASTATIPPFHYTSFADLPSTANDGVPDAVYSVLGIDPANPTQLVAGVSNLQAIKDGLKPTTLLPETTGIVGALSIAGSAQTVQVVSDPTSANHQTAFVAAGSGGLAIVDATNPVSPVVLSQTALPGNATDVDVAQNLSTTLAAVATGTSLQILDVTDPKAPAVVQTIAVNATRVKLFDGMAFVNDGSKIDTFDVASGQKLQSLTVGLLASTGLLANIVALTRDGTNLYAADDQGVVYALSIGSGGALSLLGFAHTPILGDSQLELSLGEAGAGLRMAESNGIVYLGNPNGRSSYATVDVSNPSAPKLLAGAASNSVSIVSQGIAVDGAGVGVGVGVLAGNLIDVFDTSNPSNDAAFLSKFTLPAQPFDVTFGKGLAFVADGTGGLQIVGTQAFDTQGPPPALTITSGPGAGLDPATLAGTTFNFTAGQSVAFGLTVVDKLPVVETALLLNGKVIATDDAGPSFNLSAALPSLAALTNVPNGAPANQVILQLRVTDQAGRVTLSGPITGTLAADTTAPVLVSQNVAEGATVATASPQFAFNFSKPLDPTTVTNATFSVVDAHGNAIPSSTLELVNGGQTVVATFASLPTGKYQFLIDAANVTDRAGNALGASPLVTDFNTGAQFTDTWISPNGGDWNNAANWSAGRVPTAADSVLLQLAPGATVTLGSGSQAVASLTEQGGGTLTLGGTASLSVVGALTMADNVAMNGGTLTVGGAASIAGQLQANGGTFTAQGTATIGSVTQIGGTLAFDQAATLGSFTQFAGTLSGPGVITVTQSTDLEGGNLVGPGTLTMQGQATLHFAHLGSGFALVNAGSATATAGNSELIGLTGNLTGTTDGSFTNLGTLISLTSGGFRVFLPVTNSGTIQIGAGSSLETADFNSSGSITLGTNAILSADGNGTVSGTITGASGSIARFGNQISVPDIFTLTGAGQITGASVTIAVHNSTIAGSIALPSSGSLATFDGVMEVTGSITGDATTSINSSATAVFEASSTLQIGAFRETGRVAKFLGSATIGALSLGAGSTIEIDAPTTAGALTLGFNNTLSGSGTLTVTGTATIAGGILTGTGRLISQGTLNMSGGFTLDVGAILENQGSATSSTSLRLGGTFINDAGATYTTDGDFVVADTTDTGQFIGTFVNNGTYIKNGTGSANFQVGFTNNGTLEINGGIMFISGPFQDPGTISLADVATLEVFGNLNLLPSSILKVGLSAAGVGQLNVMRGTANLSGTLVTLPAAGFTPAIGSIFTFLTLPARNGTFTTVQEGALPPGEALTLDTALNLEVMAA